MVTIAVRVSGILGEAPAVGNAELLTWASCKPEVMPGAIPPIQLVGVEN